MPSISTEIPSDVPIYPSLEEFENNLPSTVKLLHATNGSRIYLVGTAHFSLQSQADVSLVMQNVRPDRLVLELCPMRLHILYFDEERLLHESSSLNYEKMRDIYRHHGLIGGMFYIKFLNINASVTRQLGMAPGGECRRAVAEAANLPDCQVLLGDRPIKITMQRAIHSMTLLEKFQLTMFYMFYQSHSKITKEDVELLKLRTANDAVNSSRDENEAIPSVYKAFVTERDLLLSHSMQYAAISGDLDTAGVPRPLRVVGVVGIGHTSGILKNWDRKLSQRQVDELMTMPTEKVTHRLSRASLKYGALGLCGYALYKVFLGKNSKSRCDD